MEYDYRPIDPRQFERVPSPTAAVGESTPSITIHHAVSRASSSVWRPHRFAVLVNTSFNGFREPIVCSPRDAVRVFFGAGLDVMFADQFVVEK